MKIIICFHFTMTCCNERNTDDKIPAVKKYVPKNIQNCCVSILFTQIVPFQKTESSGVSGGGFDLTMKSQNSDHAYRFYGAKSAKSSGGVGDT